MAVVNYAASVQGVALRVTRLDSTGRPMVGPENVYVTRSFMRLSFTPEYEEGDEITEKNAAGEVCVTYKSNDTLKRATMELAVCDPDPELTELLTGGVLLKYGPAGYPPAEGSTNTPAPGWPTVAPVPAFPNMTVGYASVRVNEAPNPNGVGIEVWSRAIRNGAQDNDLPYYRWVFPKATLRPSGDRVIENGLLANAFEGWSVGNMNFGTGPADDWYWPDATDRPFLYARDFQQPWKDANGWVDYDALGAVSNPGANPTGPTGLPNPEFGPTMVGVPVAPPGTPAPTAPYWWYTAENPAPAVAGLGVGTQAAPTGPSGPNGRRQSSGPTVGSAAAGVVDPGLTSVVDPLAGPAAPTGPTGSTNGPTGSAVQ
jgi:hypothetical protein